MSVPMRNASPRTAREPMAFTRIELGRGAFLAWCTFMILLLSAMLTLSVIDLIAQSVSGPPTANQGSLIWIFVVLYAGLIGGLVGLVVAAFGMPVAYLIGHALRRLAARWVHVTAYTGLGAAVGALAVWIFSALLGISWGFGPMHWLLMLGATVSVPTGWWLAYRRAIREDRGLHRRHPRSAAGPDERAEDDLRARPSDEGLRP